MARIFLSYSHQDRHLAEKLANALKALEFEVWWDDHLQGGDGYRRVIEDKLKEAAAAIVIWSSNSIDSRWVLDEADAAASEKKLLPVRFEGFSPEFSIPLGFGQVHIEDMTLWDGSSNSPEIKAIEAKIENIQRGKFRDTMLEIGGRTRGGQLLRSEAFALFQNLDASVGGIPLGRFVVGVCLSALAAMVMNVIGVSLSPEGFSVGAIANVLFWILAFVFIRGALQFSVLSRSQSSRRFFDQAFSFWVLFSVLLSVLALLLIAFVSVEGNFSLAEFLGLLPVFTVTILIAIMSVRVVFSGMLQLARRA